MSETPDEILRALADPQRLAIAGFLARGPASARTLADALDLPVSASVPTSTVSRRPASRG